MERRRRRKLINKQPYKVIFCGVVKNADANLKKNINLCINNGKNFEDYRVVIYENNSTDNTKHILKEYENDKIIIKCEDLDLRANSLFWSHYEVTG